MNFKDCKVVKIDRTSPCSMEYYVQIIPTFGARPMYHFEKKKDALEMAKALKEHLYMQFNNATEADQNKALQLLQEFNYSDECTKRDYWVKYI